MSLKYIRKTKRDPAPLQWKLCEEKEYLTQHKMKLGVHIVKNHGMPEYFVRAVKSY